ncbi:hypothetical protein [Stutzerimonas stutzeri]|uniref:hypothetical protein n=1 Tax=Stutzerimonas stutzeri TaxID=316 RepID=UPI001C2EE438|nr:hypothetical protein [Stutzerimonas stutzeri]
MNTVNRLLIVFFLSFAINTSHAGGSACAEKNAEDVYNPILLGDSNAIRFKKSETPIVPDGNIFPIIIVEQECDTENETQFAELPYLGDPGVVDSAFLADSDFDGKAELFVIHRVSLYSDTGISYGSDYFTTLVYKRVDSQRYERNEHISAYFGEGGDVLSSSTSEKLIYDYPFKSEAAIKSKLASAQYKAWLGQSGITTRMLRKAYLHDQPNVTDKTLKYLIAGDEVLVLNQTAGWLEVVFHNKKKGDIKGWIQCKDTLECASK